MNPKISSKTFWRFIGVYDYGPWGKVSIRNEGAGLFFKLNKQRPFQIFPKSENTFFAKKIPATLTFIKNEDGDVIKLEHRSMGEKLTAPKIKS